MRIKQNNKTVCYICPPYELYDVLNNVKCLNIDGKTEVTTDILDEKYAEWASYENCLGLGSKGDFIKRYNFSLFCDLEELISYESLLELEEWYYDESQDYEDEE